MTRVKILPKGQITIPKGIRKKLDLKEGDFLTVDAGPESMTISKEPTLFDLIGAIPLKKGPSPKQLIAEGRRRMGNSDE